jgi:hypothetical protein
MKKVLVILLVLISFSAFTETGENNQENASRQIISFDFGAAVRFNFNLGKGVVTDLLFLRTGIMTDLIFYINRNVGLGIDSGIYGLYTYELYYFLYDIPLNAIVKLTPKRFYSFEFFGGMYLQGTGGDTFFSPDIGTRLIFRFLYFELTYLMKDPEGLITGFGIFLSI